MYTIFIHNMERTKLSLHIEIGKADTQSLVAEPDPVEQAQSTMRHYMLYLAGGYNTALR